MAQIDLSLIRAAADAWDIEALPGSPGDDEYLRGQCDVVKYLHNTKHPTAPVDSEAVLRAVTAYLHNVNASAMLQQATDRLAAALTVPEGQFLTKSPVPSLPLDDDDDDDDSHGENPTTQYPEGTIAWVTSKGVPYRRLLAFDGQCWGNGGLMVGNELIKHVEPLRVLADDEIAVRRVTTQVRGCSCGMADYGAPGHDHDDAAEAHERLRLAGRCGDCQRLHTEGGVE